MIYMKNILTIKNISKKFAKKDILKNISFEVKEGEIFGLIGVNGIGKTTLIKIILDLLSSDEGNISIFGKDSKDKEARSKVSYLPEKFTPSIYLKGKEFLSFSLGYFKKKYSAQEAKKYAESLDLDVSMLESKVTKYSKGMGQKLGLISMFLSKAPLLILDEPMSGLDPHVRIRLKDNLKDYAKNGNSVFFSSHILSDIDEICDRIGVIHKGELVFVGTAAKFKKEYNTDSLERAFLEVIKS